MNGHGSRRREELLGFAEQVAKRLRSAAVPYLADPSNVSVGVPPTIVGQAVSFLARVRDMAAFREFLARFDQLDAMTAQNPDNPKADHRVVREEVEAFLADHPDLLVTELLYVLAWVRRLLPRVPEQAGGPGRHTNSNGTGVSQPSQPDSGPPPIKGGQLAAALRKAQLGPGEGSGQKGGQPRGKGRR